MTSRVMVTLRAWLIDAPEPSKRMVTLVPRLPRIKPTISLLGQPMTSTIFSPSCATPMMRSPDFTCPDLLAGPPSTMVSILV